MGTAGYGYLLKDRVAEGSQLADAIRRVATGGTALDPAIVEALVQPLIVPRGRCPPRRSCMIAEGKTIKIIAAAKAGPPAAVDAAVGRSSSSSPRITGWPGHPGPARCASGGGPPAQGPPPEVPARPDARVRCPLGAHARHSGARPIATCDADRRICSDDGVPQGMAARRRRHRRAEERD